MKGYIHRYFALLTLVGAWAFTGCTDDVESLTAEGAGCFNLVVTVPDEAATRATDAEVGFNEFKVTKLHFYFYKIAGHDDATSQSVYDYVWDGEDFNTTQKLTVPLPADALTPEGLFGGGATDTQCKVYAVANVDEKSLTVENPTIDQLKATAVTNTFDQTKVQPLFFAMDGVAEVTIDRTTRKATGKITLQRAAAKITLAIKVDKIKVTPAGGNENEAVEYTPNTDAMHVWISNGVKNSKLNTAPDDESFTVPADDLYSNEIESVKGIGSGFVDNKAAEAEYKYVQEVPFYSYPNKWEQDNPDGDCYLTLVLPWSYTDAEKNTQQVTTYYRIPVQPEARKIERNMHYDIRVTIARLGSTEQTPIEVEVDWNYAIPWNEHKQPVDIKQVRYLLLNNNYYDSTITNSDGSTTDVYAFEMNNTTDIEIPVGTSHDVEIAEVTMSWIDYSINPPETRTLTLTRDGENKYSDLAQYNESNQKSFVAGIEMDNNTSMLLLKRFMLHLKGGGQEWVKTGQHWEGGYWDGQWVEEGYYRDVPTEITTEAALNSYTFDIKLQHADDNTQTAMVHITQYPPIYITAEETTDGTKTRFINNNNRDRRNDQGDDLGYLLQDDSSNDLCIGSLHDDYANNKNTYIITISRFDALEEEDYIIADPRTRSVDNLPANGDSKTEDAAWSMSDGNRRLKYYYPADANDSKKRYIAPKIRIASQWGVTYDITRDGAKRRCASYQENGRPAGRWRLPTIAEIEFIARLSSEEYIPYLFGNNTDNNDADYWCGSGAVMVHNKKDNDDTDKASVTEKPSTEARAVRCVYDDWYWGDDILTGDDAEKFTWGDKQRTTSGNSSGN